jgi:hypothetical protein
MLNRDEKKMAEWFFNLVGVFCHYSFFTEKLWKKVKGFENKDEAESLDFCFGNLLYVVDFKTAGRKHLPLSVQSICIDNITFHRIS